jgi:lipoyl(octanoyl) transferase
LQEGTTKLSESIDWKISKDLVGYDFAISEMEKRVLEIKRNSAKELVWLLEHESIYTGGTSAKKEDLKNDNVETRSSGRGGQWTWHGPGQRVIYLMLNLRNRQQDVKAYVYALEEFLILTLYEFSINGTRVNNKPGVWVKNNNNQYDKICALGIRISSWVTFHGVSINVNPDLDVFKNIVPCGVTDGGITSLQALGKNISLGDLDHSLKKNFEKVFGSYGLFKVS